MDCFNLLCGLFESIINDFSWSLTNKPASASSPNASYKNYPISYLRTFYIIYQPTILTHPGKNRTAHSPPTPTPSSKHSSPRSSPLRTLLRTYPNMPSSSVNWAYELAVLVSYAHVHGLPQTLSLLWLPLAGMLSMVSKFTRTSPTSPSTKPTNATSKILQRFHCILPHIAEVACAPSIPPTVRINHFLTLVSPKSARSRIKLHLNDYITHSLYNEVFTNAPDQFHLLPSLLSPQTSYPLIGLCRSNPHNRLLNWQFDTGIKRKLRLPLHPTTNQPICACGTMVDIFGDHIFK